MTEVLEIDAQRLSELLAEGSVLVVDVRERHEVPAVPVPHVRAPMSGFAVPDTEARHVVFVCQHGIRSLTAGAVSRAHYDEDQQVYSLKGGVVKWLTELR